MTELVTARRSLEKLLSWDFDKLINAYGDCIEKDAKPFVREDFRWLRPLEIYERDIAPITANCGIDCVPQCGAYSTRNDHPIECMPGSIVLPYGSVTFLQFVNLICAERRLCRTEMP